MGDLVKKNKCFEKGASSGDLREKFDELQGKIDEVNDLITTINTALGKKINASGGTLTGTLNTQSLIPSSTGVHNLGSSSKTYDTAFLKGITFNNGTNIMKFDWDGAALSVLMDNRTDKYFLASLPNHSIHFSWSGSLLGVYIDNTFVGNLSFA